jgi:2-polyprenyl-6-methoxyphenol hydroxylase-like FAD-dependent oxidoreductase
MTSNASIPRVLISGAGAAGEVLAFFLNKEGIEVTVVEKWPTPRSGGFAIDLRGAALEVADRMDLLHRFRASSVPMNEVVNFDPAGEVVWRADGNYAHSEGDVELLRDSLTTILSDATHDIEHLYNDVITGIEQREDGVRAIFAHSAPGNYDLVVGADGLHSNVRALAFGAEDTYARYLGYYTAVFDAPNVLDMDRQMWLCTLPGLMASLVQWGPGVPTRGNFIAASPRIPGLAGSGRSEQMRHLHMLLHNQRAWHVPKILQAMHTSENFYFDEVTQIHSPAWNSGRVVLVGDAAYAPTLISGQGTSIAVVGAYVLAREIAAAGADYKVAFGRYEERMRPFVDQNQRLATDGIEASIPATQAELDERNAMIRSAMDSSSDNLDDTTARAANAIDLSPYA